MKNKKKILFSIIMSVMMMVTFIPCTAMAANTDPAADQSDSFASTDEAQQEFVIEAEEEAPEEPSNTESNDLADADIYGVVDMFYRSGKIYQNYDWVDDGRPIEEMPLSDVHVYMGGTKLVQNEDFTISYENNEGLQDYSNPAFIIFKGIGKYTGDQKVAFQIVRQNQEASVDFSAKSIYAKKSDSVIKMKIIKYPVITGSNQGETKIKYDKNYLTLSKPSVKTDTSGGDPIDTYTYKITGKKAGSTKLTVTFSGNEYYNPVSKTYTIKVVSRPKIIDSSIKLSKTSYTYNTKAKKPSVTVVVKGKKLKKNTHYTVKYKNNVNAGTATVIVKAKGGFYQGTASKTFKIKKASQNINMKITPGTTLSKHGSSGKMTQVFKKWNDCKGSFTYTSSNTNVIKVSRDSKHNGVVKPYNDGTAKVTVTAAETKNFKKATKTYTFTVNNVKPIKAEMIDILCISHEKHDVTVFKTKSDREAYENSGRSKTSTAYKNRLVFGTDWTNKIVNNKDGSTTVTVTGKGRYSGSVTKVVRP